MMSENFAYFLEKCSPSVYSYAYALIPDHGKAKKLLLNAIAAFLLERKDVLQLWEEREESQAQKQTRKAIYRQIYLQAKKSPMAPSKLTENHSFFSLSLDNRSVLFLKHRTTLGVEDIQETMALPKHEVYVLLGNARQELMKREGSSMKCEEETPRAAL